MKELILKLNCLLLVLCLVAACGKDDSEPKVITPETPAASGSVTISTPAVTQVTSTTAVFSALVSASGGLGITERGFCYATTAEPTTDNITITSAINNMQVTVSGLRAGTTYYVRGYAVSSLGTTYSEAVSFTTEGAQTQPDGTEEQTEWPSALRRVSVHDPSVVWDPSTSNYYIFGSHRAAARSTNLMTWVALTAPWATAASTNAQNSQAFLAPEVTKVTKGGKDYDLNFNAFNWSKRGSTTYSVDGNMWAPDVIFNKKLNKWCMYLSINGDYWYSSIIMLTADRINGPYRYQAPVVISGFHSGTSYKDTDLEIVLGTQSQLPSRYNLGNNWGRRYPNCIDPCVFYDEEGNLWMSYGSWSGGIWMLQLDENTGLRDYDVEYTLIGSGDGLTSDPYYGKKIAGGYYASGEASYIEYIGGYYFLFVTNGGLAAGGVASDYNNGGYQMRVFRSKTPDGPYLDSKNSTAILSSYLLNFGPQENDNNRGVNIFGAYTKWGNLLTGGAQAASGERSQGHNSIIAAEDGRTYLVYHTRFQDWGEGHQVRVHQVYQNEEGWLVACPFEYTGERMKSADVETKQCVPTAQIPGKYNLLFHEYKLDHRVKAAATPKEVVLDADGNVEGSGFKGTWTVKDGTSYVTITIGTQEYKGVMVIQTLEPTNDQTPSFTGLCRKTGVTLWAYKTGEN